MRRLGSLDAVPLSSGSPRMIPKSLDKNPANRILNVYAAWPFDEGAGATITDHSGNSKTGDITGASWVTTGKFSNGLSFDGVANVVIVSGLEAYANGRSALTLLVCLKTASAASNKMVMGYWWNSDFNINTAFGRAVGKAKLGANNYTSAESSLDIADGVDHYVAFTFDKSLATERLKIFRDGVKKTPDNGENSTITNNDPFTFGALSNGGSAWLGVIAFAAVFSTAKTEAELATINKGYPNPKLEAGKLIVQYSTKTSLDKKATLNKLRVD